MIEMLFCRSEKALEELAAKYGKLCHAIAYNILNDQQDAEECVNDAYLGVWNTIPPENPRSLCAYLCKIVRNLSLKRYNKRTAAKRNSVYDVAIQELENCLPAPESVELELELKELTHVIESFLNTLSEENCAIFMGRYWFCESYAEISRRMDLSEKNVSVRLVRIRNELRQYLQERGL